MRREQQAQREVNPSRVHLEREVGRFARATRPGMLVLDAGAGRSPYRELFAHAQYEAADFAQLRSRYAPLDYVCDLTDIPVEDGRFHRVLFNQVLEHLPEPAAAIAELHRVLKPGGRLFCSVPLFYGEHQVPYDFFRYTRFGLRRIFEDAGFCVIRLHWLEGYFGTLSYQFAMMGRELPVGLAEVRELHLGWRIAFVWPVLVTLRFLAPHLSRGFARMDVAHRYTDGGMPKNYVIVLRKPHEKPQAPVADPGTKG
jgi:SAM-dependent methyltransferase